MSEAVVQTILQIFGAGFFGFMIARYTLNNQKVSKKIIYDKNVLNLLSLHKESSDYIRVSVKKSVLTSDDRDNDKEIDIKDAHAHSIRFKNNGNTEVTDLYLDISFDDKIKIISYSLTPEPSKSFPISIKKDDKKPNLLHIYAPYLNKNQIITASIITTGSSKNPKSTIVGNGKGIDIQEFKENKFGIFFLLPIVFISVFLPLSMFESYLVQDRISEYIPEFIIKILGGKIIMTDVSVAVFPLITKIITISSVILLLIVFVIREIKKNKF